jgi:L-ascorbate metabolism protein UlaG (beta-lactamase superfamily)
MQIFSFQPLEVDMRHLISLIFISFFATVSMAEDAKLTWLGHAAFQLKTAAGKTILIDPWISNPKAPKGFKLSHVDAVLVTHGHMDHVGEAFELAKKNNAVLVASHELTEIAKAHGVKTVMPINQSGSQNVAGVTVTATNAVHSSSYSEKSKTEYAGAALGFIIEEAGTPTVYHAGDTGVFNDMALIKELYKPEVVLLPIGGVYTMKPKEAAQAVKLLGPKAVVPMHWGTFDALTGTPQNLQAELINLPSSKVKEMIPGQELTLKALIQ